MPVVTIGDNTGNTYPGMECLHLRSDNPTVNYGTETLFNVSKYAAGNHRNGIIVPTGLNSISGPITVNSATLYLYLSSKGGNNTFELFRLLVSIVEAEATWNISSTGNNWNTAGALGDGVDRLASSMASKTVTETAGQWISLTSAGFGQYCEDVVNGTITNNGFMTERTDGADDSTWTEFRTDDYAEFSPYILLDFTAGGGGGDDFIFLDDLWW
jgi:hypothetical protein